MNNLSPSDRELPNKQTIIVAIVDTDFHQLQSLSRGITLYGHSCVALDNHEEALVFLKGRKGDGVKVVIVNVSEDLAAGVRFILDLRNTRPSIPIIVIRGLEWNNQMDALKKAGIYNLQDPFSAAHLDRMIQNLPGEGLRD